MADTKIIAIDIETTGLYPIASYQLENGKWVFSSKIYCISINDGKSVDLTEKPEQLRSVLENPKILKVIHNASFDCFWLRRVANIRVRNIWDTRLMEQVLLGETLPRSSNDENLRKELSSSLLYTLPRYGLPLLENKSMGAAFATRPVNKPLTSAEKEYAKNDVRYLLHLQALQERRLINLDLMRVANLENRLVEVLVEMRHRGIGFDTKVWKKIAATNHHNYNEILKRLPPTVQNWNSPQQVKKFFNGRGIPIESLTGIEEIADAYNDPILNKFIELRGLYKDVTTYGDSWLEDTVKGTTVDPDGRIRTDYEQILNTGRLSSSHPNIQNIKRDGLHRSAFVAGKGKVFIIADYTSQEIGIAAAASGEEIWIKAILRREDIHSLTGSLLYPDEWRKGTEKGCKFPKQCECKVHKIYRQHAKVMNFAIMYGSGAHQIALKLKMSNNNGLKLLAKYRRVVPKLTRWLENNGKEAIRTRISFSADPFKRRRLLRDPEDWMLKNIGKNNPVQSCGANMLKLAMVSVPDDFPLVHNEHDSLIAEVDNNKKAIAEGIKVMKGVMEKTADYCTGVPGLIIVEPRVAKNLLKQ